MCAYIHMCECGHMCAMCLYGGQRWALAVVCHLLPLLLCCWAWQASWLAWELSRVFQARRSSPEDGAVMEGSPFCLPGLLHIVWGRELWANAFILSYLLSPAPALEISFLKENLSFIYYDYFVSTWASVCVHMYHNMYGIRGWLSGIGSCFHCRLQRLNSYHQGHLQTLSPAEPSW